MSNLGLENRRGVWHAVRVLHGNLRHQLADHLDAQPVSRGEVKLVRSLGTSRLGAAKERAKAVEAKWDSDIRKVQS